MKSGLKYLIIVFLFAGSLFSEVYGAEKLTTAIESRITSVSEMPASGTTEYTVDLPIFLLQNMLAGDTNAFSHYLKVHTHLLCNIKDLKKSLFYSFTYQKNKDVDHNRYIYPLKYYVYTLEKIVI